jgi:glycosyltransferase involved in cell wall biosynthesis
MTRKRVLMVAFHFPPLVGTSGIERTLRFARYLPEFGWEPEVLTAHPRAYDPIGDADGIPPDLRVHRAQAFDTSRHFAIAGRYPAFLARPDRWMSWRFAAVPAGLRVLRRFRPHVIWSTYPIATAHAIGGALARISRLPWVADFRDPMAQDDYPADPATWRHFARIEAQTVRRAARSVFVTRGAAAEYRARYPECRERIRVIENGYDEESFAGIEASPPRPTGARRIVVVHSGIVYPSERDPTTLFAALRSLLDAGRVRPGELLIRFRAPVHDALIDDLARRYGVRELVEVAPRMPYREALAELAAADGLLVLQAANCNRQVPAKLYEYLRARRPILGLADPAGDTADVMRRSGVRHIAALEDAEAIAAVLVRFIGDVRTGSAGVPDDAIIGQASRRERTAQLAQVLDEAIDAREERKVARDEAIA